MTVRTALNGSVSVLREPALWRDTVRAGKFDILARRIVIATGSRPAIAPILGLQDVPFLTNETLFQMKETPDHLIILGGGPIGLRWLRRMRVWVSK